MIDEALAPAHDDVACRSRRHARAQHLITADEHSILELELLLQTLPICATGRVFIEVPDPSWIRPVEAPARMTVTWLDRSARRGAPGTARFCGTGVALTRAVTAYADEVLCDDAAAHGQRITLLSGFVATADILEHLTQRRGIDRAAVAVSDRLAAYL